MLRRNPSSKKAFTLLELIVVIVILAILAAIAIPTFTRVIERSEDETAGLSLASAARNAQAINSFSGGGTFTPPIIDEAVGETIGKASGGPFELAPNSLTITPGEKGTASSQYAQVGLALSENSDIMALSMRSTTGRCVWVKAEATSGTIWQVSKDKLTDCDSTLGLTLTGSNGESVDVGGSTDGENPDPDGGEGSESGQLIDPNDPDSATITGDYCVDNNCATPELLNASALKVEHLGDLDGFLGLAADADHQQMIGTREDGIYFVNLETGDSRNVYPAGGFSDIVYLKGGYLFVNDGAIFQKFKVTSSGVSLVDDKVAELTQNMVGFDYSFPTGTWSSNTLTGDIVKGGANLYFVNSSSMSISGQFDLNGPRHEAVAKMDINGKISTTPVAHTQTYPAVPKPLSICSVAVDANYIYIHASSPSDSNVLKNGEFAGIWRLAKDASDVNLDQTDPWLTRPIGCTSSTDGTAMTAPGDKIFMSDGDSSIISIDKNTKVETLLAGEGLTAQPGGNPGVGRAATFGHGASPMPGITMYKGKLYATDYSLGSRIYAMSPAALPSNNIDSRPLVVDENNSDRVIASLPYTGFGITFNPGNNGVFVPGSRLEGAEGSYLLSPSGDVTLTPGHYTQAGSPIIVGDRMFNGSYSSWVSQKGNLYWYPFMAGAEHCMGSWSMETFITRNENGTPWCMDMQGFTSYETSTQPRLHQVDNMEIIGAIGPNSIAKVSLTGTDAYVLTQSLKATTGINYAATTKLFRIDLSVSNPSPVLVNEFEHINSGSSAATVFSVAVSATDFFVPTSDGIVKMSKTGGHELIISAPAGNLIKGVAHNGTSLFYLVNNGDVHKVG